MTKNNKFIGSIHKDNKIRIYNEETMMIDNVIPEKGEDIFNFEFSPQFKYLGIVSLNQ